MKGILLAGGSGSRLYPLTKTISKQLLPVYDKPMIYYPLSTLMQFEIKDILIISTPQDTPNIQKLLGSGEQIGMNLSYKIQEQPRGIAQAFTIGSNFVGNDNVCLILGDNIFHMDTEFKDFKSAVEKNENNRATIFAYQVSDPERFGVVEFDKDNNAVSIEEKPKQPKSNFASVGLYFYPPDVVEYAWDLKLSARGEYEITDLNNVYLRQGRMSVVPMHRGNVWLDAGTPNSLMDSGNFVQMIEARQGIKIACIEEIAYNKGFIGDEQMESLIEKTPKGTYRAYLERVLKEKQQTK
ncbi:MAG: glucose-1-phosphate thymidylyltransferase RfbA [Alphaproteobacteria bacterium]|nr:glucose-1-phosphate thymidylyltransferase RfbA [Alphaproteobacteria bacterium]